MLRFAIIFQSAALAAYFVVNKSSQLYLFIPLLALFQGLSQANLSSFMSRLAVPGQQGEAMGIYSSVTSLAQVPAAILVGYVANSVTSNTPLKIAAGLTLAAGLFFALAHKSRRGTPSPVFMAPGH